MPPTPVLDFASKLESQNIRKSGIFFVTGASLSDFFYHVAQTISSLSAIHDQETDFYNIPANMPVSVAKSLSLMNSLAKISNDCCRFEGLEADSSYIDVMPGDFCSRIASRNSGKLA